jgi:Uma2 family endonuclease
MAVRQLKFIAPEQYLEIERRSEFKSEYISGEMIAMSGTTLRHATIVTNFGGELRNALRGKPCKPIAGELRVRVLRSAYLYPDVVIYCGKAELVDDAYLDTLLNPTAIIEVLSKSTQSYDRGEKFFLYRQIETLTSYTLVSQDEPRVEQYTKQPDGSWTFDEVTGLDAKFSLLNHEFALSDIYEGVDGE